MRRSAGSFREARRELAKDKVLTLLANESEGRRVPEYGRATVAENYLVAVGELEQLAQACANATDQLANRFLPMRRAQQLWGRGDQCVDCLWADLGGSAAKATVLRQ